MGVFGIGGYKGKKRRDFGKRGNLKGERKNRKENWR